MLARMSTKQRIVAAISVTVLLLLSVICLVAYFKARSIVSEFDAGPKHAVVESVLPELNKSPQHPVPLLGKATTVLLLGADQRHGETSPGRSDTMILMRIIPNRKTVSLLSIPRDLQVNIPGYGSNKINAAYAYGGSALAVKTVRETFGVTINHFAEIDMKGFIKVIQNTSGVYLPVDQVYYHVNDGTYAGNWSSINLKPGYQRLTSSQALQWARFRHLDSDYYRAARQQLLIRELGRQIKARDAGPIDTLKLVKLVAKATTSDIRSVRTATRIAYTLRSVKAARIYRSTVAGTGAMIGGGSYQVASASAIRATVESWAHPWKRVSTTSRTTGARSISAPEVQLVSDGGAGLRLSRSLRGLQKCSPTVLPTGYRFPTTGAARRYKLNNHPAAAMYATQSSGNSILWMWTTWQKPPVLNEHSQTIRSGKRTYQLYTDSGKVRMIAWRIGSTRAWITNTLMNKLSKSEMIALAKSCK